MDTSKPVKYPCKDITYTKSNCCQGTCIVVPVTLYNVCENEHLLVIVEVYKCNRLYTREIRKVFTGSCKIKDNDNSYCSSNHDYHNNPNDYYDSYKPNDCYNNHNPNNYCNNCNSNDYYDNYKPNDCYNNHNPKDCCNNCNSKDYCDNYKPNDCCNHCHPKEKCKFYVGDFEFYFIDKIDPNCISIQVKTQCIYDC